MNIVNKIMEKITNVWFTPDRIYIRTDADEIYSRPLEAFPILKDASGAQREEYTIELGGEALRWKAIDEDIHISSFLDAEEPQADNEVARIFKRFPQLNVSEVARGLGMNKSLLSKYIYGIKKPSEQRVSEIKDALRSIGMELATV